MSRIFYDHLVSTDAVISCLLEHAIAEEDKAELLKIIDELYHHHLLNVVLSHLPKNHHREFVTKLTKDPGDPQIMVFLKSHIEIDIETEITKQGQKLSEDLQKEIKKHRRHA